MNISIIRGAFLNPFELQNYTPLVNNHQIKAVSSKYPINEDIGLPLVKLWSLTDLPIPAKYPILNRLFDDAQYLFGLERVIKDSNIVHVAETYFHFTKQAIIAKHKGLVKKVVSTVWEIIPHNNESLRGRRSIKEISHQGIDRFLCPTVLAKDALVAEGTDPDDISVIKMGVDLDRFQPIETKASGQINILCVARLIEEKGIRELIAAYRELRKLFPNVILTLVGSGPLESLAKKSGVVVVNVNYRNIHLLYQMADVFCLLSQDTPTWQEQYGMSLIEAMACGLPVVTSGLGATHEVAGPDAFIASTPSEITKALKSLIENQGMRKAKGKEMRKRAERYFNRLKIAKEIEKFYQSTIES